MNNLKEHFNVSIIIPAYNEGRRIRTTLRKYAQAFRDKNISSEILVVLNGCTDNTRGIVEAISAEFPEIRTKIYPDKLGKGGAIIEGYKYAKGNLIAHVDADGSTEPSEMLRLIENIGPNDGIIGSRWLKDSVIFTKQHFGRRIASRVFNIFTRLILGISFKDTQCGAKVFRREVINNIVFSLHTTDYAFDACLLFHCKKRGFKIKEYPINWSDKAGSKIKILRQGPQMLFSLLLTRISCILDDEKQIDDSYDFDTYIKISDEPFISIVIPCKCYDKYVEECISKCLELDYKNYEIILLPDEYIEITFDLEDISKIKIIPTGKVKPSQKRNIGVKRSDTKSSVIAFIDSDAYPNPQWLKNSLLYFEFIKAGGVGGPNLTPESDSIRQKASGDIFTMPIAIGQFAMRYMARFGYRKRQTVQEMPSCNLLVRKDIFTKIGGFDVNFLTAEDAKLCFEIRKLGKKVMYAPDVIVFHHRRFLFGPHLKQVWIYGRDKAWLIKEDFSRKNVYYLIPLCFLIFLIFGFVYTFKNCQFRQFYYINIFIYLIIILLASLLKQIKRSYLIFPGVILSHISYGLGTLYGLLTKKRIIA